MHSTCRCAPPTSTPRAAISTDRACSCFPRAATTRRASSTSRRRTDRRTPRGAWRPRLPRDGAAERGFGAYRAANYDELIDHPVETGEFAWADFRRRRRPARDRDHRPPRRRPAAARARSRAHLPVADRPLRRSAPFDRYLFQVTAVGDGYGGLEHRSSTSLLCRRDELPHAANDEIDDDYLTFLGLASHEYFHAWNVKRIKPAAFVPYDLTREALHAAALGVRRLHVVLRRPRARAQRPDRARALSRASRPHDHERCCACPGRLTQSVADSSFDAWIKFYRQDENTPNAVVSYYAQGRARRAARSTSTLRRDGSATLDDLMRALWQRYGRAGHRRSRGRHPARSRASSPAATCRRSSRATSKAPRIRRSASLLADFGVTLHLRPATGAKDRGGKPGSGAAPRCTLGVRLGAGSEA